MAVLAAKMTVGGRKMMRERKKLPPGLVVAVAETVTLCRRLGSLVVWRRTEAAKTVFFMCDRPMAANKFAAALTAGGEAQKNFKPVWNLIFQWGRVDRVSKISLHLRLHKHNRKDQR
ncbi:MAG: hypothetical protein OXU94_11105 [Gammaproteobacteria bacterium]|nr:hypothetical protein [Gammaproteobacteria bacterium]